MSKLITIAALVLAAVSTVAYYRERDVNQQAFTAIEACADALEEREKEISSYEAAVGICQQILDSCNNRLRGRNEM